MSLPKIDTPVYDLELPISKKKIKFRPFLVKEQKNLLMAMEADDVDTITNNIKQILINCTISDVDIDSLPIIDIEYYFLHLRARSVGEIVESKYRCNNEVDGKECGNVMDVNVNILEIPLQNTKNNDIVKLTDSIQLKLKYPDFSTLKSINDLENETDITFEMILGSIDCIYDDGQAYYAKDATREELMEFIESLNTQQFEEVQNYFRDAPRLYKNVPIKCNKCGFQHDILFEGLESFFD